MKNPKIISLVPSLTELLCDMGLNKQLCGRTKFCIYPKEQVKGIPVIGGTKNPDIDRIRTLNPDIIIANKEENRKEDVALMEEFSTVIVTDISNVDQASWWIRELGYQLNATKKALQIVHKISDLLSVQPAVKPLSCAYLIWKDPWMTIGGDTYVSDVLDLYNLDNVFRKMDRYPSTTPEELAKLNPELILLSSEPYPFKEKHKNDLQVACPGSEIQLVNGEWFSWYGSRMITAFELLNSWREELSVS